MSSTSSAPTSPSRAVRVLSVAIIVIGVLVSITGAVMYTVTGSQLSDQHAKVNADAPSHGGEKITDPFTALAQIEGIQVHADAATGDRRFGEIPQVATRDGQTYSRDVPAAEASDGKAKAEGDPLTAQDAKDYSGRNTAQTASFLQASLFLSVLAFGVSAFIVGIGIVVALIGVALLLIVRGPRKAAPEPAAVAEAAAA